jgi:TetR/AcrR family transcriptional regulator, mexJK operon transcriptional repressor
LSSTAPLKKQRAGRLASGGAIRAAAAGLFLEKGYAATSMDEIAAAAKVSKQTIYTHFVSKVELFEDLVMGNAERVEEFVSGISKVLDGGGDLEVRLRKLARHYLTFVARPEAVQLRRLIISEASRFPELAHRYYELVPARVYAALAAQFRDLNDRGLLRVDDPSVAAQQFAWLTIGMPIDRGMFYRPQTAFHGLDLDEIAEAAARVFLAAYHR